MVPRQALEGTGVRGEGSRLVEKPSKQRRKEVSSIVHGGVAGAGHYEGGGSSVRRKGACRGGVWSRAGSERKKGHGLGSSNKKQRWVKYICEQKHR